MHDTIAGDVRFIPDDRLSACHVSNGEQIVAVSRSGHYELPWIAGRHRFIFVIPPDGYRAVGRFWRHGPIDRSAPVNFVLRRFPHRRGEFSILHVTDFHVVERAKPDVGPDEIVADFPRARRFKTILRDMLRQTPGIDFVIATGDLTNSGDEESLAAVARVFKSLPFVIYPIFGGHDGNTERFANGGDHYNVAHWTRHLAPPYYSWHWRGRHFISHVSEGTHFLDPVTRDMHDAFVAEDLRLFGRKMPVTVCSHKNPFPWNEQIFQKHRVDSWFHGHFHSNRILRQGRIRVFSTSAATMGALDGDIAPGRLAVFPRGSAPVSQIIVPAPRSAPPVRSARSSIRRTWSNRDHCLGRLAAPCVVERHAYCGIVDESSGLDGGVACIDLQSGKTKWTARLRGSVESPIVHGDGQLFAITQTGLIAALDARTGRIAWRHELANAFDRWINAAPLLHADSFFAGTTSCLVCLSTRDGRKKWEFRDPRKSSDAFGQFQGALALGNNVFIAGYKTGAYLFEAETGRVVCRNEDRDRRYASRVAPAGNHYVIGDGDGVLSRFDLASGQLRWRKKISENSISSAFVPLGDDLVGGTAEGILRISMRNGKVLSRRTFGVDRGWFVPYRREARSCPATPLVDADRIIVASGDGYLNLLRGASLKLVDRAALKAPIISPPASTGPSSFVGIDVNGELHGYIIRE